MSRMFLRVFVIWAALSATLSCKPRHEDAAEIQSSDDPDERSKNSKSNLPEFAMTKELKDVTRRLTNNLNTCWLQAGLKEIEFAYYREKKKAIRFSPEFMMMNAMHDRYYRIIDGGKVAENELEAGGEMNEVRRLIRTYGLMPEDTWKQKANAWGVMATALNPIAVKYKDLMKKERNKREEHLKNAEAEFQAMLNTYGVKTREKFYINGKEMDPVQFANSFAAEDPKEFVMFISAPQYKNYTKPDFKALATQQKSFMTSWTNIQKAIIDQINEGRSVVTSIVWSEDPKAIIVEEKTGIMTVPKIPLPQKGQEGHVVNIVGYQLSPSGKIHRLKIENTWGRYSGPAGFYSITWDEFEAIYVGISVPDGFAYAAENKMNGSKILK